MTTSTRDDRVHPYHARAFTKRLLDTKRSLRAANTSTEYDMANKDSTGGVSVAQQNHGVLYYENIEGGHGGAADNRQQAFMNVSPMHSNDTTDHISCLHYSQALYLEFLWKTIGKA